MRREEERRGEEGGKRVGKRSEVKVLIVNDRVMVGVRNEGEKDKRRYKKRSEKKRKEKKRRQEKRTRKDEREQKDEIEDYMSFQFFSFCFSCPNDFGISFLLFPYSNIYILYAINALTYS